MIPVIIPPLRERSDDILPLAQLFMKKFSGTFRRDVKGFTAEAERALLEHSWPGNVRELRNRVERAVALSQAPRIGAEALFSCEAAEPRAPPPAVAEVRHRAERHHIRAVLVGAGGRVEAAAKLLGVWRSVRRRRSGGGDLGPQAPLAPTPVMPDRPNPLSGGAAAHVEVTAEPPPDAVARRTVLPGKARSFTDQRRRA